jgi:hypothetical protein
MGRRSRTRLGSSPAAPRRVLAGYLGAALVVGVAVLVGIVALGGNGGPLVVLAFALGCAGLAFAWARRRLAAFELAGEERLLWMTATGVLLLSVALAAVSALLVALT